MGRSGSFSFGTIFHEMVISLCRYQQALGTFRTRTQRIKAETGSHDVAQKPCTSGVHPDNGSCRRVEESAGSVKREKEFSKTDESRALKQKGLSRRRTGSGRCPRDDYEKGKFRKPCHRLGWRRVRSSKLARTSGARSQQEKKRSLSENTSPDWTRVQARNPSSAGGSRELTRTLITSSWAG